MNKYELTLIIASNVDEEGRAAEVAKMHDIITRAGGVIAKVDEWGRRRLAYPIKKQNDGYYSFTHFTAPANIPGELEARLRITESVLRYLVIRVDA